MFGAVISLLLLPSSSCSRGDIGRGFPIPVDFRVGREFASSPGVLHSPEFERHVAQDKITSERVDGTQSARAAKEHAKHSRKRCKDISSSRTLIKGLETASEARETKILFV